MTHHVVEIWCDPEWTSHTHGGTGPWAVSEIDEDGGEIRCHDSRRTHGAALRVARSVVADLLGRRDLRGLSGTRDGEALCFQSGPIEVELIGAF